MLGTAPIVSSISSYFFFVNTNQDNSTYSPQQNNHLNNPAGFNTAYRSGKIGFANVNEQRKHEMKYNEKTNNWQGPVFTDYWGRNYTYPFNAQQIMKDSSLKNFTLAFLNPLSTEDETQNMGAGYIDSFQEIRALGGDVTVSFGGWTPQEVSFFNQDPSGEVMYQHLKSLALGYNVSSFDFDIENVHKFGGQDAVALSQALAKLKTLLAQYGRHLQVRFTEGGVDPYAVNTLVKYYGTDFIWNDMWWTRDYANGISLDAIKSQLGGDAAVLRQNPAFSKMSTNELYHHIGFTFKIEKYYTDKQTLLSVDKWAVDRQLGLVAIWDVGNDHKINSPLDPTQNSDTPQQKTDFYYTNTMACNFEMMSNWNQPPTKIPGQVKNLRVYAKSKNYISLKWDPVTGAKYYLLEDQNGNVIRQVDRCFGAISFREYPKTYQILGTHRFKVVAVNGAGKGTPSATVSTNITSSLISDQIEYYDANIDYHNIPTSKANASYYPFIKYVYYQNHIYEDVNTTQSGIAMNNSPSKDTNDWKLLGVATDPRFGLSKERIADLKNFEWDQNINDTNPLTYVNFLKGSDTSKKVPKIYNFLHPIILESKR